jgi:hypothetical protein
MVEFILYVKNQQLSKEFYQKLLSASPVLDVPGMTEFLLEKNVKLGLMPEDGIQKILANRVPHPATGNGIPRCELYLYISTFLIPEHISTKPSSRVLQPSASFRHGTGATR